MQIIQIIQIVMLEQNILKEIIVYVFMQKDHLKLYNILFLE